MEWTKQHLERGGGRARGGEDAGGLRVAHNHARPNPWLDDNPVLFRIRPPSPPAERPEPAQPDTNQPRGTETKPRLTRVQRRLCCSCRGTAGAAGPANWGPRHRDDGHGRPGGGRRLWLGWPSAGGSVGIGFSGPPRLPRWRDPFRVVVPSSRASRAAPAGAAGGPAELAAVEGKADQVQRVAAAHTQQQLRVVALPAADAPRRALPPAAACTRRPGRRRPRLVLAAAALAAAAAAAVFGGGEGNGGGGGVEAADLRRAGEEGVNCGPRGSERSAVLLLMAASLRHRRQRPGPLAYFIAAET